jgi:phosphohistidine phosphatase
MEYFTSLAGEANLILGLFRHGPAGKGDPKKFPDDDLRPLTPKGRKTVKRCAKGLAALGFAPTRIFTSPVKRSRETAELLRKAFRLPSSALKSLRALHYETPPRRALQRLSALKLRGHVLVVGHEPWLGECLSLLVTGRRSRSFPLRKAGFAAIAAENPGPGQGRLLICVPPEILETLG